MVGAARRKARLPRKILRVILSDGSCQLQPQVNGWKIKEGPDYTEADQDHFHIHEYFPNSHSDYHPQYSNGHHISNGYQTNPGKQSPNFHCDTENRYDQSPGHLSDTSLKPIQNSVKEKPHREKMKETRSRPHKHQHPEPTPEFPYQCDTCDMLFKTIDVMTDHQTSVHQNNRQFSCRYCSKKFNDKYNMRKHVLIHVGEKRHKCQFCEKAFLRKDHLRSHLQTHYNRKFGCKICSKSFRTMELYQRHTKTHKEDKFMALSNSTDNGGKSKSPNNNVKKEPADTLHETSIREDDVAVTILDDDFTESIAWGQDSPVVSENDVTMVNSPVSGDLNKDEDSAHSTDVTFGVKCRYCNEKCCDGLELQVHEKECSLDNQNWQCMKCNIVFDQSSTLKQHYDKVHSIDKPVESPSRWKCKTCDINYPNSKELSRHYAQAHKDAQIFPCSECPKTFTVWHNLKKHMLIHLGDKKHKCSVCDKGFVRKDHLNSHMKVHLGEGSKFTCPVCDKVFRLKQMYFKHMNLHGLEKTQMVGSADYF